MRFESQSSSYRWWALLVVGLVGATCLTVALSATGAASKPKCFGKEATKVGGPTADTINGTNGKDVIVSLDGGDSVDGKGGNDLICTGQGADGADGGPGNDKINGGFK